MGKGSTCPRSPWPRSNTPWPMANGGWGPWPRVPPGSSWCHPRGHVANLRLSISASTAPRPRMHPPRRCSGVVAGRLPRPFRPALSTVSFPSWGRVSLRLGDASSFCSTSLLRTLYRRVHLGSRHTMHASEVSDADPLRCISCMLLCSGSCKLTGSPGILKFPGGADAGALRPPQDLHMPCWAYPVGSRPFYSSCDSRVGCPSSRGPQGRSRFTILLAYCFINLRLRKL